ncbi:ArsR family transcriptional regulator [Ochrobactrum sp. BH3]|nr:ArsR family transcriptional regulator [Ochrobactrum sp. BH3]
MKNQNPDNNHLNKLSQTLSALANPIRLSIVEHLQKRDMCVGALAEVLGLSQSALSHHLKKLKKAGLVKMRKDRQMHYYALTTTLTTSFLGNSLVQELLLLRH